MPSSRGYSRPRDRTLASCIAGGFFFLITDPLGSPLYSTGNYIQYPVINLNGKAHEKECVCVCVCVCVCITDYFVIQLN